MNRTTANARTACPAAPAPTVASLLDAFIDTSLLHTFAAGVSTSSAQTTIDRLESWTMPAPTFLAPPTICWVSGGKRDKGGEPQHAYAGLSSRIA